MPEQTWEDAYNATDCALGHVEGLALALKDLVWSHFNSSDKNSRALTALVNTIDEKMEKVFELRSAEFAAGRKVEAAAA